MRTASAGDEKKTPREVFAVTPTTSREELVFLFLFPRKRNLFY